MLVAGVELGPAYLFFGCRKKSQDYIYEQELAMYSRNGVLQKLFVAFSRDAADKVYVQNQMQQQATDITEVLSQEQGGNVYVCGDAKRMAKDVHAALLDMLQTTSGLSSSGAEDRMKDLTNSSRYQRDVW
jgi:NADPH-ferrihemoprotein reductase